MTAQDVHHVERHGGDLDLAERSAVIAVDERDDVALVGIVVGDLRGRRTLEHQLRHLLRVPIGPRGEEGRERRPRRFVELRRQAEVEDDDPPGLVDQDVAGMEVGVHEAIREQHLEEGAKPDPREPPGIRAHLRRRLEHLRAAHEPHGQHVSARQLGIQGREADVGVAREVRGEAFVVAGLDPEVELGGDRAPEFADALHRREQPQRGDQRDHARHRSHHREIEAHQIVEAGAANLDRDLLSARERGVMDLCDRCGRDRRAVERREQRFDRAVKVILDRTGDVTPRERPDIVLQPGQRGDDVRREQVRAGRHDLSDLDERRPQADQQGGQSRREPRLASGLAAKREHQTDPSPEPDRDMREEQQRDEERAADEPEDPHGRRRFCNARRAGA